MFPTPSPIVVCAEFENIGSEVVAFDYEILDHDVDRGIRVLNTGDRDVSDVNQELRNDDLGQVLDKMWFESWLAVFVITKVMEQLLHGIAESLVLWVSIKLVADELDFIKDAVGVTTVFVAEEIVALVIKSVPTEGQSILQTCDYVSQNDIPLIGRSILHNIALLLEAFANVRVNFLEPAFKLRILVGIAINLVDGIEEVIE